MVGKSAKPARSAEYRGRDGGALMKEPPAGCAPARYHRVYLHNREPVGRSLMAKRGQALCKDHGCRIYGPRDLAAITTKLLGAEISKREHVFLVLIDSIGGVRLIGGFSSKHVSLCAFRFDDMVPDLNVALQDTPYPGGLYMIHNHPSGGAAFSQEDVWAAEGLVKIHEKMPFGLVDSIVVTKGGGFVSLREEQERLTGDPRYRIALRGIRFRDRGGRGW